jgi:30S ribosomal protein S31
MGKGDKRTKRGKIHIGSTGVSRPKKKKKVVKKAAVKTEAKKTPAKKSAAKKASKKAE